MVTLRIDVPDVERRIRELAAARQMDAEEFLVELVTSHLPEAAHSQPAQLSIQERKAILYRIAARIPMNTPPLSDEAFSRDNLYDERGR